MVILHVVDIANPQGNGVSVAVSKYLEYESKYATVGVYNLDNNINCPKKSKCFNYKKYKNINMLDTPFNKPDLVVFNEVYKPKYIKLYKYCLKNNIPYVIIPHGCLIDAAQSKKSLKKKIANLLMFNKFIKKASAIQFLNDNEYQNTKFKYKKSIISGNGIEKLNFINKPTSNKKFIYIGRYSIKVKGLDLLVAVCKKYKDWFVENDIKINLYGRKTENSIEELNSIINENELCDIIIVNDAVYGNEKEKILKDAYCFIQLSRHEGQPMGIIEALACGLPCIVTYGTTLGNFVNDNKCGIGVEFNEDEVFEAVKSVYDNLEMRNDFSENSINVVNKNFDWDCIIEKLIKDYKKLKGD